jgi:uncharacterized paraquat-inducible protein A
MKVECPSCRKRFNAPDEYEGREAKCPVCKQMFKLVPYKKNETVVSAQEPERTEHVEAIVCANCERIIGKLEQRCTYNGKTVCSTCHSTLTGVTSTGTRQQACLFCGLTGSVLLLFGSFAPLIKVPFAGSINYFRNGEGDGVIIIIIAVISAFFTLLKKFPVLWFTGIGSLLLLAYTYLNFQQNMDQTRSSFRSEMQDNPFAGLGEVIMESVQLEWGWVVLILGGIVTISAAAIARTMKVESESQ